MCRSPGDPCKRRCRDKHSPERRKADSARQRVSRWARACDQAMDAGDKTRAEHCERLMDKALADLGIDSHPPTPTAPTKAPDYTPENTAHWTDEDFENALQNSWEDPRAVDQLMHLVDERDAQRRATVEEQAAHERAMESWSQPWAEPTPMTSTTTRASRKLSATEHARAEFETYVDCQWLQAESDCNGVLLTAEARAKGIDSRSLFSGRIDRAIKYASPELQSWWGAHGRLNFSAFRYQMLGRDSDRTAAERVKTEHFEMAPSW